MDQSKPILSGRLFGVQEGSCRYAHIIRRICWQVSPLLPCMEITLASAMPMLLDREVPFCRSSGGVV